jgi:hypothetical protein
VDVCGRGDRALRAARLLRGHVARRSYDGAILGQFRPSLNPPGQSEIGNVGLFLCVNQDVAGLEIAVQDPALVGMVDGPRNRRDESNRRLPVTRILGQPLGHAAPLDQLHAEVAVAVVFAHLMNRHDVRMVEVRDGFRFPTKTLEIFRGRPSPAQDHLDGNRPIEPNLARLVDHAHSATANLLQKLVIAE